MSDDYIDIDPTRIFEEWRDQPRRFLDASKRLADARADAAEAKIQYEIACAEVSKRARNSPEDFDIEKVTDKAIEVAVTLSKKVQKYLRLWNEAKHQVDLLTAEVQALEQRKKALENSVWLTNLGWKAEPRLKQGVTRERIEEMSQEENKRRNTYKRERKDRNGEKGS